MTRKLFLPLLLMIALLPVLVPAQAQGGADGWTDYELNLRAGPGTTYGVITLLPSNTGLVFEAHNADLSWLLGHTEDGAFRGWVSVLYIRYREGFAATRLPASEEVVTAPPPAAAGAAAVTAPQANTDAAQTLMAIPVLPSINGHVWEIFRGSGNDPHTLLKVGDCNSEYWEFLGPLGTDQVNLGPYSALQSTVDYFKGSWGAGSFSAHGGFNVTTVQDPAWANPNYCQPGETPLHCDLRFRRPAVAVMMFGANDVFSFGPAQYEASLRQDVSEIIANGTIPVLTTFTWCRSGEDFDRGLQYNLITVAVAQEFNIPLINFWRAAQNLPGCGLVDPGDPHLSKPVITTAGDFSGEEQRTGHTLRNLLTLQTLDAIRAVALP